MRVYLFHTLLRLYFVEDLGEKDKLTLTMKLKRLIALKCLEVS